MSTLLSASEKEDQSGNDEYTVDYGDERPLGQAVDDALSDERSGDHDRPECQADGRGRTGHERCVVIGHEIRAAQAVASEADWRPMAADVSDEARAALLRATYERSSSAATAS